jgi:hypothetical protein
MKKIAVNTILFVTVTFLALLVADALFIQYEKRFLKQNIYEVDGTYNLHSLHYNDTTVTVKKPAEEFRTLSLGDSFTEGITRYEYSYTQVIAKTVNDHYSDYRFRAVNVGEAATGLIDYLKAYEFWSERIEHDAVIVNVYLGNDIAFLERHRPWTLQPVMSAHNYDLVDGRRRTLIPQKYPLRIFDYIYAYISQWHLPDQLNIDIDDSRYKQSAYFQVQGGKFHEQVYGNLKKTFRVVGQVNLVEGYRDLAKLFRALDKVRAEGKQVLITLGAFEAQVEDSFRADLLTQFEGNPEDYDVLLPTRIIEAIRKRVSPKLSVLDLTPWFRCRAAKGDDLYFRENTHYSVAGDALHGIVAGQQILAEWFSIPTSLPPEIAECDDWSDPYLKKPVSKTDAEIDAFVDMVISSGTHG